MLSRKWRIVVKRALVVPQPQGALYWCAQQNGSVASARYKTLVMDVGSRTFDWLVTRGMRLAPNMSDSVTRGVSDILQHIADSIGARIKEDIGLIGSSAIEADGTLRDFDYREVKVARAIIGHSREVWLAADHSKFNLPAMVELGRLDQVDTYLIDQTPPAPFPARLAEAGVNLKVCNPSGTP